MKNIISLIACIIVSVTLLQTRYTYSYFDRSYPMMLTNWDGLGYYMYLPSGFIYDDFTELDWYPEMNEKYHLSDGNFYQAHKADNGNYVNKYLGGVSIMQMPLFGIAHVIALNSDYPADGFSPPYQYTLAYGAVLYCILALFLLRNILLRYYDDLAVSISLILLFLASNLIQYISVDAGLSHVYIFPLYVLILYATVKWHEKPTFFWAAAIGLIIGLATISRPTEAIMLFIPLLWNTQSKEAKQEKWALVRRHKKHIYITIAFGLIGILPQLIYWKMTAGTFIHDVGSSWRFLTPFFRVLFGWETGWFIYTPVTILFIAGFFFMKNMPFRRSVIIFCLLNIWIIISWADWKYGAQYSTRALTQSYPIFALPLTAVIHTILQKKWKWFLIPVAGYLIFVNLFQIGQYNDGIIHTRDNNRLYYAHIYLNSDPTPVDMSLLDTDEILNDESGFKKKVLHQSNEPIQIGKTSFLNLDVNASDDAWLKISATIKAENGFQTSYLACRSGKGKQLKKRRIRLFNVYCTEGKSNSYEFFYKVPKQKKGTTAKFYVDSEFEFSGILENFTVVQLTNP
ncbi:MAG: hypothetical protein P8P74_12435 [Crocinitomicaceae bacterium]|nr:hypothetical protein [Crocinitomicaceae bacterium]